MKFAMVLPFELSTLIINWVSSKFSLVVSNVNASNVPLKLLGKEIHN